MNELEYISRQLEEDIALGRILPRERLIEEELAARFKVNRHVIRQVLSDLESIGIIVRQRNKGATVRDLSPADVENIYAVRELLEGKAAELIKLPPDPAVLAELKDIQRRHADAAANGNFTDVFRLNLQFHKAFFAACGNPQLAEAIQHFALKAHIARSLTISDPELLGRAVNEHKQMLDLMETGDRQRFVRMVVEHIIPSKDAYMENYRRRFGGSQSTGR
ncbi:MAG: GntR family transcriptional regulator [Rhodospirillales bacterium]|nr:GntR family transcriptional regulator [Rhodospirillales bacterium]